MKNNDIIYINFPISLLKNTFENIKETIDSIFNYVVYKHSLSLEYGNELERMKSASNFFKINFGNLEHSLKDGKETYLKLNRSPKYPNVSININLIWDYYKNHKTEYEIACFCSFCAIKSIIGSKEYAKTNKALILSRMFGESSPNTVKEDVTLYSLREAEDYIYDKYDEPIHLNKIKSAIKNEKLKAIKNSSGYEIKVSDLCKWYESEYDNELNQIEELKKKYSTRYHIDKILFDLQENWNLRLYSDHCRGFYLSFKLNIEELALINEKAKRTTKMKLLAEEKKKAKELAIKKLGLIDLVN